MPGRTGAYFYGEKTEEEALQNLRQKINDISSSNNKKKGDEK